MSGVPSQLTPVAQARYAFEQHMAKSERDRDLYTPSLKQLTSNQQKKSDRNFIEYYMQQTPQIRKKMERGFFSQSMRNLKNALNTQEKKRPRSYNKSKKSHKKPHKKHHSHGGTRRHTRRSTRHTRRSTRRQ